MKIGANQKPQDIILFSQFQSTLGVYYSIVEKQPEQRPWFVIIGFNNISFVMQLNEDEFFNSTGRGNVLSLYAYIRVSLIHTNSRHDENAWSGLVSG